MKLGGGVLKTKSPLAFHSQVLARKDKSLSPSCWALAPSSVQFSSVQLLSCIQLFATVWATVNQASLSFTISRSLLKFMFIESVMSSNHLILCLPLLLPTSIFPSIRVFSNESVVCIRWPKCYSLSVSISPSSEHPGLVSFRMDCSDFFAVQRTVKSLLKLESEVFYCSSNSLR